MYSSLPKIYVGVVQTENSPEEIPTPVRYIFFTVYQILLVVLIWGFCKGGGFIKDL